MRKHYSRGHFFLFFCPSLGKQECNLHSAIIPGFGILTVRSYIMPPLCACALMQVHVLHFIRWHLPWRAPPWAAACSAGRRARGSGSGCGSSSKTRCSTPSQPVRWGGTESPTPAPKLSHTHSITEVFPNSPCLSSFFFTSTTLYVTNEGILCALCFFW